MKKDLGKFPGDDEDDVPPEYPGPNDDPDDDVKKSAKRCTPRRIGKPRAAKPRRKSPQPVEVPV